MRMDLQYLLAPSAKELANEKQPITDKMFGDNMQDSHKDLISASKVTKLTTSPQPRKPTHPHLYNPFLGYTGCGTPSSGSQQWFPRPPQSQWWGQPRQAFQSPPRFSNNRGFWGSNPMAGETTTATKARKISEYSPSSHSSRW